VFCVAIPSPLAASLFAVAQHLARYQAVAEIVNDELPRIYTHYVLLPQAGVKNLKGYAPAFAGPYSIQAAGLRTASMS
jgi:hypothetical protein